jgi:hypothetical protein
MPDTNSPTLIVARFLKSNNYNDTLETFLAEAGLDPEASTTNATDWTLEQIIEEKAQFDASLTFEKTTKDPEQGWHLPAPAQAHMIDLQNPSNVLCVAADSFGKQIMTTHADKSLLQFGSISPYQNVNSKMDNDSPILSISPLTSDFILTSSMSGQVALRHTTTGNIVSKRRDHLKMAVQVTSARLNSYTIIATAGWDQKVHFYLVDPGSITRARDSILNPPPFEVEDDYFSPPIHTLTLPTVPESILFVNHPDNQALHLILSRRDSSFLYYYEITPVTPAEHHTTNPTITYRGRQNLAPHSTAWVSFTPSCLRPHPNDPTLLAIATSHLPHMKLIIVRLLFPSQTASTSSPTSTTTATALATTTPSTQPPSSPTHPSTRLTLSPTPNPAVAAAHLDLALQDLESASITTFTTTLSPQTPYSTPNLTWRPSGTGVWVNGDDGVIRGIEVPSGKVVAVLKEDEDGRGHEAGSKVRCLWAGMLRGEKLGDGEAKEREVLVSGGFDRRVIVWECQDTSIQTSA